MDQHLKDLIRSVPDFPKKGIVFRDITTLLENPAGLTEAVDLLARQYSGRRIDKVASVEARGFILGGALAYRLGVGFVPIRKPGKLPAARTREEYTLEYGTDAVEIHSDAIAPGDRVLIHDDLLATGGTIAAAAKLVERLGGTVAGLAFLIELTFLKGRDKLRGYDIFSIVRYEQEQG